MHFLQLQTLLPQQFLCTLIGKIADCETPWVKNMVIGTFLRFYPVNLSECLRTEPSEYRSFNDFFTRKLRPGARPISAGSHDLVSPADGSYSCLGNIEQSTLLQAKGHRYQLAELLVDEELARRYENGQYATIYLAPTNYHRVHLPFEGELVSLRYVPGRQFSVNRTSTQQIPNIYARNERLIANFNTQHGNYCLVMVGALLVAGISTQVTGRLPRLAESTVIALNTNSKLSFSRGDEFGAFHMGSTVILLTESGRSRWQDSAREGYPVRLGEKIGSFKSA